MNTSSIFHSENQFKFGFTLIPVRSTRRHTTSWTHFKNILSLSLLDGTVNLNNLHSTGSMRLMKTLPQYQSTHGIHASPVSDDLL